MGRKFKIIKKPIKPKLVKDLWDSDQYRYISLVLKEVLDEHYETINKSIHWTEGELERLEKVKMRRIEELHYNRYQKSA